MAKLISVSLLGLAAASSFGFVFDDFSTGAYNSGYFSAGTADAWVSASGAAGGTRFTSTSITANPLGGDARARVVTVAGIYAVGSEAQVDVKSTLGYGYASSSTVPASNPLNLNLSAKPVIDVVFDSNDVVQPVVVTLFTNGGANQYTRTVNAPGGIATGSAQSILFDFSTDAANLVDVDSIKIDFDPAPGGDFALTTVQAVPEPASFAVIGVGVAALLRRRRK